ncbi:MAG: hypothetical protein V2I33_15020 [Kangiellaceae bacterium]|nr:hypothetical protein [Kangiellaceae bacterium]
MKRLTLGIITAASLILTGCDVDDVKEPEAPSNTVATWFPAEGDIPVPNDILFGGTEDLTINLPVADPNDFGDPLNAISTLDGWSTTAPISIGFSNPDETITLDATTVVPGQTVRVFKVTADTDFNNPLNGIAPTFAPYAFERELAAGTEYVAVASGTNVVILPTRPLEPRSTYVVVATNGIQDSAGLPVIQDAQYTIATGDAPLAGSLAGLAPLRTLVNIYESFAVANGVDNDSIVISMAFTTQSVGNVLGSAKALYVDFPIQVFDPLGNTPGLPTTPQYPASSFSPLPIDTADLGIAPQSAVNLFKGQVTLNYLLDAPTQENPTGPLTGFWRAADMVPDGQGGMVPNPLAGGFLTYVNSLPGVKGQEQVPLMVSLPKPAVCPQPAGGYPVAIFQHGITGNRTQMVALADSMAQACTAVVSMDLPLHGIGADDAIHQALQAASQGQLGIFEGYTPGGLRERTFGVDYIDNATSAPGPDGNVDDSGAHFINLPSLLTSRDNLRQAVLDLLALKSAIPAMDVDGNGLPDFDANQVSFVGISLGGIVGSSFVAYADEVSNLFAPIVTSPMITSSVLNVPGGGIAGLLDASDTFSPVVRGGVAASAGLDPADPAFAGVYQQFLFAAQTIIDSADPINTAAYAVVNDVPTLLMRVAGDAVVPNNSATAPLSGTDPLAAYLNLTLVAPTDPGPVVGPRLLSRFNTGTHGSLLTPAGPNGATEFLAVTVEMQTQAASFVASAGAATVVTDPSLLN